MSPPDYFCASLADQQINRPASSSPNTLAIALGANLPSNEGPPLSTLKAARPKLETLISDWLTSSLKEKSSLVETPSSLRFRWSPLFETDPVGGSKNQPIYINAVVVIDGPKLARLNPSKTVALNLLERLLSLERLFGRKRNPDEARWGPRSLDLDLLAWGDLQIQEKSLILPHPRLIERNFVITPLAAALSIDEKEPRQITTEINW